MSEPDTEQLLQAAVAEMKARGNQPLTVEAQLTTWFDLISMVQLALRFPGVLENGAARRSDTFIRELIEQIDPQHGDVWRLLCAGFNPEYDQQ